MKKLLLSILSICTLSVFGQQMTSEEWRQQEKDNIRLLPKYGYFPKTDGQKSADKEFIETTLKKYPTIRAASAHLIDIGFKYLYEDIKISMYRFNQAYLLDSTNTDIYWGYGGVYMTLGEYAKAEKQFLEGLAINPSNTHLLTDYGTYFMAQYYVLESNDKINAAADLDSAISYLTNSYKLDSKDQNTLFKLSVCYFQNSDCENAWKYYNKCKSLGGQPITEDFTKALNEKCKRSE